MTDTLTHVNVGDTINDCTVEMVNKSVTEELVDGGTQTQTTIENLYIEGDSLSLGVDWIDEGYEIKLWKNNNIQSSITIPHDPALLTRAVKSILSNHQ